MISLNERFTSLAKKLDEFIISMKESQSEMRADNIRRDDVIRQEINTLKKRQTEDIATMRKEHTDEIRALNETVFMLKGAVALVYLTAAVVSIWTKFGG